MMISDQVLAIYGSLSALFLSASVYNALSTSLNYFTMATKLSEGFNAVVVVNAVVFSFIVLGKLMTKLLFNHLRIIEEQHVQEKFYASVMSIVFTVAMFRDDPVVLVGSLLFFSLFIKIFHWILLDRLEFVLQNADTIQKVLYNRITIAMPFFLWLDYLLVKQSLGVSVNQAQNPLLYIIFGVEHLNMFLMLFFFMGKALLNMVEIYKVQRGLVVDAWEHKNFYIRLFDIAISFVKTVIYGMVVSGLVLAYRFPLTLIRDFFISFYRLVKLVSELVKFYQAAKELDSRLVNATETDLARDNTCIICLDEMTTDVTPGERRVPKKLVCGHVIHLGCLKGWLERSQRCPTCRGGVFEDRSSREGESGFGETSVQDSPTPTQAPTPASSAPASNSTPMPTPTSTSTTTTTTPTTEHPDYVMHLPQNSIRPPGWTVIPLERTPSGYDMVFGPQERLPLRYVKHD